MRRWEMQLFAAAFLLLAALLIIALTDTPAAEDKPSAPMEEQIVAEAKEQLEKVCAGRPAVVSIDIPAEKLAEIKEEAIKEAQSVTTQTVEKAKKKLDAAEEACAAAEAAKQAAEEEVDRLRKQLAVADTATAIFREKFSTVQKDLNELRAAWENVGDPEKREKLAGAVRAVLAQQNGQWGR